MRTTLVAGILAASLIAGCSASGPTAAPPAAAPTANIAPATPAPAISVHPTEAPTPAPTVAAPTPTPSLSPNPGSQIFDAAKFVAAVHDESWVKEYPKVAPAKIWKMYQARLKADGTLARVVGKGADFGNDGKAPFNTKGNPQAQAIKICFGSYLQPGGVQAHVGEMQEACPFVMTRLIWYANQTGDKALVPLIKALSGWVAHSEVWDDQATHEMQETMIAFIDVRDSYLDGTCDPDGLWACLK